MPKKTAKKTKSASKAATKAKINKYKKTKTRYA